MKRLILTLALLAGSTASAFAGCGVDNPNCVAPTAPPGDNSTRIANTKFVQNAISSGSGGVSSVGLALPASVFNVSGSPVAGSGGSGTLTGSFANQSANLVFAGPSSGSAAAPSFRALVSADIPAINLAASGNGGVTGTLAAGNGGTGATSLGSSLGVFGGVLNVNAINLAASGSGGVTGTLPATSGGTGATSLGTTLGVSGGVLNVTTATVSQLGAVKPDGTTITISGGVISSTGGSGGCTFANPSATIGLTAVNGSATTCMRSDAAPALSQAITPSWTGSHVYTTGNVLFGGPVAAAPTLLVGSATNPYFGSNSNAYELFNIAPSSATLPEVGIENIMNSNVGSTNASTAFKINYFGAITCSSGSASCYGINQVIQANSGYGALLTGAEIDLNWNAGANAGNPAATNAAYNLVLAGTAASASFQATAAIWVIGVGSNPVWQNGIYFSGGITSNGITDASTAATSYVVAGTHTTAFDTSLATLSYAMKLANNQPIMQKDTSGNLDVLIGVNNSNYMVIGGSSVSLQLASNGFFAANGAGTVTLGSVAPAGAHGLPQEWLILADVGGNTRYVPLF